MADSPPPETLRQPTGDVVHVNDTQKLNSLSILGKTYKILDAGYVCGNTTLCIVLSEDTCLFDPAPYCSVCTTCLHPEDDPPVQYPDYISCGTPAGLYGILVKFKPEWLCHCLNLLQYSSINMDEIEPVGTFPICPVPVVSPLLLLSLLPLGFLLFDGPGTPFKPGIDTDIDSLPPTPSGDECDTPTNPPNGNILTCKQ